jgi:hypothetical protein
MIINCMYCGHTISLGEAYESFTGPVRCAVCKNLMMVKIDEGRMSSMEHGPQVAAAPVAAALLPSTLVPAAARMPAAPLAPEKVPAAQSY